MGSSIVLQNGATTNADNGRGCSGMVVRHGSLRTVSDYHASSIRAGRWQNPSVRYLVKLMKQLCPQCLTSDVEDTPRSTGHHVTVQVLTLLIHC